MEGDRKPLGFRTGDSKKMIGVWTEMTISCLSHYLGVIRLFSGFNVHLGLKRLENVLSMSSKNFSHLVG